jgi:hypothetical protein
MERLQDDGDKREFKAHLGKAMATLNADVLMPIVAKYPGLDPDK